MEIIPRKTSFNSDKPVFGLNKKRTRALFSVVKSMLFFFCLAAVVVNYNEIEYQKEKFSSEMLVTSEMMEDMKKAQKYLPQRIVPEGGDRPAINRIAYTPGEIFSHRNRPNPGEELPDSSLMEAMGFGSDIRLMNDGYLNHHADICTDPTNGNIHVVYRKDGMGIYYKRSTNGGASFYSEQHISSETYYDYSRIAARGNYVYIVSTLMNSSGYPKYIHYWISSNSGGSFSGPYNLYGSSSDLRYVYLPDVTIDESNYAYIFFTRIVFDDGGSCDSPDWNSGNIVYYYTTNYGASWNGYRTATTNSNAGVFAKVGWITANNETSPGYADIHISVMYDQGARFFDYNEQAFDLYYTRVNNAAGSWSRGPFTLIRSHSGTNESYAWWNGIACRGNYVYLGYLYNNTVAAYKRSSNNGTSWSSGSPTWSGYKFITFACDNYSNPINTINQTSYNTYTSSSENNGSTWWPFTRSNDIAGESVQSVSSGYFTSDLRRSDVVWTDWYGSGDLYYDKCKQWRCVITLTGVDASHPVTTEAYTIWGQAQSLTYTSSGTYAIWVDAGYTLRFPSSTGGSDPRTTTDTRSWTVNSAVTATINYSGSGVWEGDVSTNWDTPGNWGGSMVPTAAMQAIIPASPIGPYWPKKTGNIVIGGSGAICTSITMGGSSQLTVTGNWTNNATFTCGTSTVIFYGSGTTSLISGSNVTTFYNMKINVGKIVNVDSTIRTGTSIDCYVKWLNTSNDGSSPGGKLNPQGARIQFYD
ncbi:hypothetical protein KAH81_09020 [bacterium]|nr:hypothetical protein [bacterium]